MRAKGLEGLTARIGRLGPGSPRLSLFGEIESSAPSSEDLLPNSLPGAPSCAIAAWSHLQATPSLCLTGVPSTATSAQPAFLPWARGHHPGHRASGGRSLLACSGRLPFTLPPPTRLCRPIRGRAPRPPPTGSGVSPAQARCRPLGLARAES